jgi:hypothetical protein
MHIIARLYFSAVLLAVLVLNTQIGSLQAQSKARLSPAWGKIVWIEPKDGLMVQEAKGKARVKAFEGMLVRKGYLLILNPTARALVICGDVQPRELKPGPSGCPCTEPCPPEICGLRYKGSTISATRGSDTANGIFPVVIAPRKTLLRSLRPTIRWSPIAGAKENTAYQVTLYGESLKPLWSREVINGTRLDYPGNEPALAAGQTYKVVVTSEGASSQQDQLPGLGFTTLTTEQARRLDEEESRRKQLRVSDMQSCLLVVNLYAGGELYAEAIEQLEEIYKTGKEAEVTRTLGDLYAATGLNREAAAKYEEALALTDAGDLDGLGWTRLNLAQAYENLGSVTQAIAQLREAVNTYRRLGNRALAQALFRRQQELKKAEARR